MQGSWQYRDKDKQIEIELAQIQSGDVYRLPMEIGIATEGSSQFRTETIEMTERKHQFKIAADKAPTSVTLDPNCWVLMKATFGPQTSSK